MARFSRPHYNRRAMIAMALYTAFMLLVWPLIKTVDSVPLKVLLAITPLIPMVYVIVLMGRRIRDSDELQQRTHLIGLGVATGVIAALSLLGGFLAIAKLIPLDGTVLIWVFPVLMVVYSVTRWYVSRRYGLDSECDDESRFPQYLRFLLAGTITGAVALFCRGGLDDLRMGVLMGMTGGFLGIGMLLGVMRWRNRSAGV